MARSKIVKGYNPAALWLLILLFVLLLGGGAYFGLIVAPAQQYARQVEATATAQSAAIAVAHSAATATAQALAALYARGEGLMNLGRWAEADAALQAVFDVEPNYRDVQSLLVTVSAQLAQTPPPTSTPVPPTPTPVFTPTPTLTAMPPTPMPPTPMPSPILTPIPTSTPTPVPPTPAPAPTATPTATLTATPTATPTSALPEVEITEIINVRSGPGTNYDVIGQRRPEARYRVIGRNLAGDWWEIDYDGRPGWVFGELVATHNAGEVAVVAEPATSTPIADSAPVTGRSVGGEVREFGGLPFVHVPAGEFLMGIATEAGDTLMAICSETFNYCERGFWSDQQPEHRVYLDDYWIGQTEVTNSQFQRFLNAGGYDSERYWSVEGWRWRNGSTPSDRFNEINSPALVSWYEAEAFANWLTDVAGVPIRLPTEAQWEKAARGTDARLFPWGNSSPTAELANTYSSGTELVGIHPAGASPYGALDMAGNVYEWTSDWYAADYYAFSPATNPTGPADGGNRVMRGGSWKYRPFLATTANRWWRDPADVINNGDFRVVATFLGP